MTVQKAQQAQRAGRYEEAVRLYRQAIAANPGSPEAYYLLALLMVERGDLAEAATLFKRCAKRAPGNVEVLISLGNAQRLLGDSRNAARNFDSALKLAPGHAGALCNRGWLRLSRQDFAAARQDFTRAIEAGPRMADAHRGLGECRLALGDLQGAEASMRQVLELSPGSADACNTLGVIQVKRNRPAAALEFFDKALAARPQDADALINRGITCEQLGQLQQAESSLQQAIAARPGFAEAHFHLAHLSTHQSSEAEVAAMEKAWRSQRDASARINLGFGLGKALDQQGEYRRAFPYFAEARKLLRYEQPFDAQAAREEVANICAYSGTGEGSGSDTMPIFVVGMPRSGTTLTEQILASHSRVHALGESGLVGQMCQQLEKMSDSSFPTGEQALDGLQLNELAATFLQAAAAPPGRTRLVDTSPMNFHYLGLISRVFPRCKIVHCRRSPLDTCLSIFQNPLSEAHAYANRLQSLGDYYLLYLSMMEHWKKQLGGRVYDMVYEDLLAQDGQKIAELLDFCELEFEPACQTFHRTERAILTPSASQVRQPLTTASLGRWRNYEEFLGPLIERLA